MKKIFKVLVGVSPVLTPLVILGPIHGWLPALALLTVSLFVVAALAGWFFAAIWALGTLSDD